MKALLALLPASLLLAACERCVAHSNDNFNRLLVKRLAGEGIASKERKATSEVCFAKGESKKVAAISADLAKHYRAAGIYVADECQEKPVVQWAKDGGLDYSMQEMAAFGGKRKGKMFILHSSTAAEAEANKEKLREAPRGKACQSWLGK